MLSLYYKQGATHETESIRSHADRDRYGAPRCALKGKDMIHRVPQVGAPDPELRTSPILDESAELSLDAELESGVCYFNDVAYPIGQYLRSGSELLHCEGRGVWVRSGEMRPE